MSTHTETHHKAEGGHDHVHGGPIVYTGILTALLFLTLITVGASTIDFGSGNVAIAMFIASIKAILVALFFMHLRYDKTVNAIAGVAGFLFLGIFLMFDFIDVGARIPLQPHNAAQMEKATPPVQTLGPGVEPPPVEIPSQAKPAEPAGEHK